MRILTLLLLGACSKDNEPAGEDGSTPEPVVVIPTLAVSSPERGAFVDAGSVKLSGTVGAGTAAVSGLRLNNEDDIAVTSDGAFSLPLGLSPGINIIALRAEDEGGERAVDGRAVYAGPMHPPSTLLQEAVRMQLGPELLDDDDDDLDDIASITEYMLEKSGVADAIVGIPIETSYATVTPTSISYGAVTVDLIPTDGALLADVVLSDLWMDFDAEKWGVSTQGAIWADAAVLSTTLYISGGEVIPGNTVFDLEGYGGEIDWLPDAILDWAEEYLEEEIAATTEEMVSALVGEYLGAFALDAELLEGVDLSVALAGAEVSSDGLLLLMDAGVSSSTTGLPADAGSAITDGAPPDWPLSSQPFSVAVDDDLVNQILFAVWASGALSDFSYGSEELIVLTGTEPTPPLGPLDRLTLSMALPPMIGQATQDDMDADLVLGEWRMSFFRADGEELSFSVNVRAGAQISFSETDELALALDNRPVMLTMAVGVLAAPEAMDPGDLAALVKLMVPPLLGNADNFLPGITLPPIDLGTFSESLNGVALTPEGLGLSMESGGWIVLDGGFGK